MTDLQDGIRTRKPEWLKVSLPTGAKFTQLKNLLQENKLNTVCESAACPNRGECWSKSTATIMILGNVCTRSCGFCNVSTGRPTELDEAEPERVADALSRLHLKHAVITSVNRDELADGGASIWARTITITREKCPETTIEVLIPDFKGNWDALNLVLDARPDVLNHNVESIPRLYYKVRPQANFEQSLELLRRAKAAGLVTKSGFMVGLGETDDEVLDLMKALDSVDCDLVTIGQYLQPTLEHLPVKRWVHPDTFAMYRKWGEDMGFKNVFSGPLVRSSYHAGEQAESVLAEEY
ncbi:MAG: lipoyl synthase [Cyanobacteria bacterium]|nr:lipoyl synthase [Cyanobacteriota bacterium]